MKNYSRIVGVSFLCVVLLALSSCGNPWAGAEGTGSVTIRIGSGGNSADNGAPDRAILGHTPGTGPVGVPLGDLVHTVYLTPVDSAGTPTGAAAIAHVVPTAEIGAAGTGTTTISNVPAGDYAVRAEATWYGKLYATGTLAPSVITVSAGATTASGGTITLVPDASLWYNQDWIPITTEAELAGIGAATGALTANYFLANDITLTGPNWTPIGGTVAFSGLFDGNGKAISNLVITPTAPAGTGNGLFAQVSGTVENLTLLGVNITEAIDNVGTVAGTLQTGGKIVNCHASGNFQNTVHGYNIGGIVGNNVGNVIDCSFTGGIASDIGDYIGGIVGTNTGTVSGCVYNGAINSTLTTNVYAGGIAGVNSGNGSIERSSSGGSINAAGNYAGGIVGENGGSATITNCYSTSEFSSVQGDYKGGIAGRNSTGTLTIEYCYATGIVRGGNYVGGIAGSGDTGRCVALAPALELPTTGTPYFGRITSGGATASGYAKSDMVLNPPHTWPYDPYSTITLVDSGTGAGQYNNQAFWEAATPQGPGWDFAEVWRWNAATNLPELR